MVKKQAGKKNYNLTQEEFIRVWETSNSADEVSKKTKMPKPIVLARVSNYRAAGINLKKMPRPPGRSLDVEGLNRLIDEIRAKQGKEDKS